MRKFCIVTDSFPPERNSAATMMFSFVDELSRKYQCDVYSVNAEYKNTYNFKLISFNYPNLKRKVYTFRAILEIISGLYFTALHFRRLNTKYTDIVYYNPSILQVFFLAYLKYRNPDAKFKLILRDIFPDWAIDTGIIRNKLVIRVLRYFQKKNLDIADIIFCESKNKLFYMSERFPNMDFQLIYNWVTYPDLFLKPKRETYSINLVYAGNVGSAQNVLGYSEYLEELSKRDFSITFFAFGDQLKNLKCRLMYNDNIVFKSTVDSKELTSQLLESDGGLVFLDSSHKLDNIPGKILSYLAAGRPVFGFVNKGSELIEIINNNGMGYLSDNTNEISVQEFVSEVDRIISTHDASEIQRRAKKLFCLSTAIEKIVNN